MSTLPLSPTRSQMNSPETPQEGVSAPLLTAYDSKSSRQTPPDLNRRPMATGPLRFAPYGLHSRPDLPRTSPVTYIPRPNFAGARESSSGYAPPAPSIRTPSRKAPQAAFLLPPETDSFISHRTYETKSDFNDLDRYIGTAPTGHRPSSRLSNEYSYDIDPTRLEARNNFAELDDELHNPDPHRDKTSDKDILFSVRGILNAGCLVVIALGLTALFAGYPLLEYYLKTPQSTFGAYNLGVVNSSGQGAGDAWTSRWVYAFTLNPLFPVFCMIDLSAPTSAYTRKSLVNEHTYDLVFSDEINVEWRSFYPGDNPYWEALDLHYWSTGNLEWYNPSHVTTKSGSLKITPSTQRAHGVNYTGGMVSTQNKFYFTGGYIEGVCCFTLLVRWQAGWSADRRLVLRS
ncbi:hypothetical protein FRC12_022043 [Ceratobasidium sp. 428]|nr:hypothetical protein FRC12_022043 [Ceratobasidium sp. 428]